MIGRVKSNDLQLNDGEVSSKHAIVRWNDKVTRGQGVDLRWIGEEREGL